jgi:hypothetical protein
MIKLIKILKVFKVLFFTTDWSAVRASDMQKLIDCPYESGREFTTFLKNGGHMPATNENILPVDRPTPFDYKVVEGIDEEIASGTPNGRMSSYD